MVPRFAKRKLKLEMPDANVSSDVLLHCNHIQNQYAKALNRRGEQ